MLGYSKLFSIKTPHGVLSKQFRYPGVMWGNEVSMDTIDLGNSESLVCACSPTGRYVHRDDVIPKAKRLKPKMVPVAGWKETGGDMDFDTIMERLTKNTSRSCRRRRSSPASTNLNRRFPVRQNLTADKRNSTARNQYAETKPVIIAPDYTDDELYGGCARK